MGDRRLLMGVIMKTYQDLEIYQMAHRLTVEIHRMSFTELPRWEHPEEARQVRRSAKSVAANIVEGFGRRRYKAEFLRFLVYAHASCDETIEHLRLLRDTGSLAAERAEALIQEYEVLSRKLYQFIEGVRRTHRPAL
jgi:four helix bundle protein